MKLTEERIKQLISDANESVSDLVDSINRDLKHEKEQKRLEEDEDKNVKYYDDFVLESKFFLFKSSAYNVHNHTNIKQQLSFILSLVNEGIQDGVFMEKLYNILKNASELYKPKEPEF